MIVQCSLEHYGIGTIHYIFDVFQKTVEVDLSYRSAVPNRGGNSPLGGNSAFLRGGIRHCQDLKKYDTVNKFNEIPMSDNTINSRIDDMSRDIHVQDQLVDDRISVSRSFSIQLDESTDVANIL